MECRVEEVQFIVFILELYKELAKRATTVRDVWAVRSLAHQLRTERKKPRITDNLAFVDKEELAVKPPPRSRQRANMSRPCFQLVGK